MRAWNGKVAAPPGAAGRETVLLLLTCAQASDPKSEDWLYLAFPREREQQLTMLDFVGLVEEGAGLHLTYADNTRSLLASERILVSRLRIPRSRFAEFARLQFLLHGFGWFPEEARPTEMAVRPVPSLAPARPPLALRDRGSRDGRYAPRDSTLIRPVAGGGSRE